MFADTSKMKAVICTKYGPPEVLQLKELDKPIPNNSQLLVKIMATAVNSGDVRVRSLDVQGLMKPIMRLVLGFNKPRKPILGTVFAGVVASTGEDVSKFKVGDQVFGMSGFQFGTYASYKVVDQDSLVTIMPKNASYEEAAAVIFGGQTAIYYLEKAKISQRIQPKVLIIGATGSVGAAAVQIAQYYHAEVTVVCSSAGRKLIDQFGKVKVVLYDKDDFTQLQTSYDIVFDAVGKADAKQCKKLLLAKGVFVSVSKGYASEHKQQLQLIKELFEKGVLKATIDKIFSMDEVVEAHRYVDTGRKKGNVVLKIAD
jgi:NADPH:quinone reductase-like Zn-dependent oxidoreductase